MAITTDWLNTQHSRGQLLPAKLAALTILLDARGSAYLPGHDTLVVSDLHLEKASFLHSFGNPLPQLDTLATLDRLQKLVADYQPARLICLGDSFHDKHSFARMTEATRDTLASMQKKVADWVWVQGNHDPVIPAALGGRSCPTLTIEEVLFAHEPVAGAPHQVIGHFHPKCKRTVQRHRYRGPCFLATPTLFIMPAFGQYTGGLDIDHEVLLALAPPARRRAFLLYDQRIFPSK
ncbi:ligase-associated DNA damage response endonuclease PdeM [Alteromonas sp. ASW11-19]|uniref:Ligase-associated DNA damage response endonuclease PdeM n=1 Tax=Alteromonas salexigens TaxID=2982530 RepID=A0ABT2VMX5_9ALTE|nr:ligase-associated DNA damage response endonuclease PdeM [Alteromonas salexigens]MCU7554599.1 ligase-associated DNA damage response endonuclease PdeM [Alteromonas salexigens]